MRVGHLCCHEELELGTIWHHLVTKLDMGTTSKFDDVLLENWLQRWIKSLLDVLEENRVTQSDGGVANIQELRVRQLDNLQVVLFLHILDPFVALTLWINNKRPSLCRCCNDAVIN